MHGSVNALARKIWGSFTLNEYNGLGCPSAATITTEADRRGVRADSKGNFRHEPSLPFLLRCNIQR